MKYVFAHAGMTTYDLHVVVSIENSTYEHNKTYYMSVYDNASNLVLLWWKYYNVTIYVCKQYILNNIDLT